MVEGIVQAIRFMNPENFWTVASVRTPAGEVTLVGMLPGLAEGMTVRAEGRWEDNARFGRRFKTERYTEIVPATKEGLARYLSSGFVPGIGDKLAQRLVAAFGEQTIEVILNDPLRLAEVKGLGKQRASALQDAFKERRGAQDALVFLMGLEIPRGLAMRILKRYGDETVAAVRQNPYKLAQEVHGIGFIKADQVARGLKIPLDHPERIAAGLVHALREARDEGHVRVPEEVLLARASGLLEQPIPALEPVLDQLASVRRVVIAPHEDPSFGPVVYLASLYDAEVGVVEHLRRLSDAPGLGADAARVAEAAARLGIELAPGQARAVELALGSPVAIVTGGPGTGKTTIIRTLLESAPDKTKVALAAPTGRAAKRMAEATARPALTIHRLLEFNPQEASFARDEDDPIDAGLVIIDEASMVDLPLFHSLLRALPSGATLVLVGDKDQLPPVGPGAPLTDLIASGAIPVARLTEIYRQGKGSAIVEAAHALNEGRALQPTPPAAGDETLRDFYFVTRDDPEQIRAMIEHLVSVRIPERFGLDPLRDIQVLAPMRAGPIGVEILNERLQALLNPPPSAEGADGFKLEGDAAGAAFRPGDKVMQLRNDYERGVFNGDMGFVRRVHAGKLEVEIDERLVVYERDVWDDLVLAYAVTVHKSQGSEYPAVVIPVSTHHFKMLRRNLLYTAVTRGKRLVVLVGTERAMRIAVGNGSVEVRESGLAAAVARARRS